MVPFHLQVPSSLPKFDPVNIACLSLNLPYHETCKHTAPSTFRRLWVKNLYPKRNPGKWNHGLKPAVSWWFSFDPYSAIYFQMAVGQNQWYHFGVGAPPILWLWHFDPYPSERRPFFPPGSVAVPLRRPAASGEGGVWPLETWLMAEKNPSDAGANGGGRRPPGRNAIWGGSSLFWGGTSLFW